MPRKINLETPVVAPDHPVKPKREITEAQREHLNKIRTLAMAKKAELKEITLKSKLAKTVPKQELAKQYDNYVAQIGSSCEAYGRRGRRGRRRNYYS